MTVSLSETERQKVRMYLGFGRGLDIHPRLESRFSGWLSAEEYAQVTDTLTKLDAIAWISRRKSCAANPA